MIKKLLFLSAPEKEEKRRFINFLRGIAIFLMIWGHCIQYSCGGQFDFFENWGFKIIYSFHMPLFMLISGYLFFFSAQKRSAAELIEYRTKTLLYPLLTCSVLNFVLTDLIRSVISKESFPFGGVSLYSLWFLWSALSCSIAVALAVKPFKNRVWQAVVMLLGTGLAAILPCWKMNIYMYPYFILGFLYARNEERLKKAFPFVSIISCAVFFVMLVLFEKKHYIYTSGLFGGDGLLDSLEIDLFRWAIGLFGSLSVIFICRLIYRFISSRKIALAMESLGQNSLAVYAISVSLLSYWLPTFINKILLLFPAIEWNHYIWFYNLIVTPLMAVAYSVVFLLIIKMLKKAKLYKLIFGR